MALQPQTPLHRLYAYMSNTESCAFSNPMLSQNLMCDRRSRRIPIPLLSILLLAALFLGGNIYAQSVSGGSITGHVEGPGGVSVPGARVLLINPATRQRKETWSDEAGNFQFTGVQPGAYRIIVLLVGFRPQMKGPLTITAGAQDKLDVSLALATPGEANPMVPWGRGGNARGTNSRGIEARNNTQLPARNGQPPAVAEALGGDMQPSNTAGLRFSQQGMQGAMASGDMQGEGNGDQGENGSASAENSFLLTGNVVNASAPPQQGHGGGRFRFFEMEDKTPGLPGFGGGAERAQDMTFFFGTHQRPRVNRLRGNLFDTYSNSALNARPYPLNTPSQPQIPYYTERVGFSLGGPLTIPKIYHGANKTSFFVHFNTTRAQSPYSLFDSVPTAAQRAGDFSSTTITSGPLAGTVPAIYEPSNSLGPRTPFPGNQIPASMINPAAQALLNYIPLPNLPGEVQNLHLQGALPNHSNFIMGRIGQEISAKDNLAGFYFFNSSLSETVNSYPDLTSTAATRNQNLNVLETHTFSPHAVNLLTANFNRSRISTLNPFAFKQNIAGELGIQGVSQDPMDWGIPLINFTNFTGLNDTIPSLTRNQTFRLSDYVLFSRGKHNFHVGGDFSKIQLNTLTNPDARGTFSFTGYTTSDFTPEGAPVNGTGYDFADFLLGLPQTTSERFGTSANYLRSSAYDFFGNDDWRVLSHLTLNLGLRWEYDTPFTEKYGHLSDLNLGLGFTPLGVVTGQNPGSLPSSLLRGQPYNLAPRFGLAYRPWLAHSLVVRAGYGIFYDESIYSRIVGNLTSEPPFATTSTLVTSPALPLTLQNGFPVVAPNVARNTFVVNPDYLTPYAQTWDLMLEQDLGQNFVLSAAYIGTRGTHLNLLLAPNVSTTGQGQTLITNALPFVYDTSGAASSYNGLRISLRRFSHNGFSFFANYTYSKSMDDAASVGGAAGARGGGLFINGMQVGGANTSNAAATSSLGTVAQNAFDLQDEWGLSSFNPTHSFHFFTRYQLPFGERKRFLNQGGVMARILGNWSISDMTSYNSGTPFTAFIAGNLSNNVNGSAPFNSLRANATGEPVLPANFVQTPLLFFNPAAFALPPAGAYGNAGRNTIPGPPTIDFNMSLDRLVTLSREKGLSADFRVSANNIFNTVNFTGLATTVNSNTFGRVTGVDSMRSLTFSVRFRF